MNDSPNKRPVLVGFFVLIGIIFLIGGILMIGNVHDTFKQKMKIVTLFDDVNGLQTGNNIWFSGVKIGTVSNLHFYGNSQVEVSMKIETKAQQYIHKDAKVKISTDGLIGNKILVIYGGSANIPEVEEGDTLSVEKTFSSEDMINTLQANNENILAITADFKTLSKKMSTGEGTVGKLLNDNSLYNNLNSATASLQAASVKANQLIGNLNEFSDGLNKKGTLANELSTDTAVFKSLKYSVVQFQQIADTASQLMNNLNELSTNSKSPVGVLLHDEETGNHLKAAIKNLESGSKKLDEDLEAAQHNFLLRGFFKRKAKSAQRDSVSIK